MVRTFIYAVVLCGCSLLSSCSKQNAGSGSNSSSASIKIDRLDPSFTIQGKVFNAQPDGHAALAIVGADIPAGSVLLWNDKPLPTAGGGSQGWAAVGVPADFYATPGTAKLTLRGPDGVTLSNALEFTVYSLTGPAPVVTELYPSSAVAKKGFNVQPSGVSALGVTGTGFLPGARIFFGGAAVDTSFARHTNLSGAIPNALAIREGNLDVWVVNPDGKSSPKVAFQISKE